MDSQRTVSGPLATFVDVFTRLAGHAHVVGSTSEVLSILEPILQEHRPEALAVAGLPAGLLKVLQAACANQGVRLLESPFPNLPLPETVDGARVGVTMAAFAVAETGSVVELARHDADRLVSSLPRVHICIVRRETIVATLAEAAPLLRTAFEPDGAMTATFISGPSRTGDIEMKLTLGVHGPEIMHAIIID